MDSESDENKADELQKQQNQKMTDQNEADKMNQTDDSRGAFTVMHIEMNDRMSV